MINGKSFLAIIPARGGSKRLPRKNVLPLAGKPLITWTIEAALASAYLDKILVSSDDDEILAIAEGAGIQALARPAEFSQDTSSSYDVIKHTLDQVATYDFVVLLQPTSPLRSGCDIDAAIELLARKQADGVISVTPVEHSPLWVNTLPPDDSMVGFLPEDVKALRSQELKEHYRLNGAIYISKVDKLLGEGSFFLGANVYAYKMNQEASVDIDTKLDFRWAEFLVGARQGA